MESETLMQSRRLSPSDRPGGMDRDSRSFQSENLLLTEGKSRQRKLASLWNRDASRTALGLLADKGRGRGGVW